jgi:hypothetical protein
MELLLSICIGVGLSAACGFRVFVPLLVTSIAANSGHLHLVPAFHWIATPAALVTFSVATVLEIGGYYIPWLDHFLDVLATPAAVVAGSILTASMISDVSPFLRWGLAIIAGGGVAGAVQATTIVARGLSLAGTGGIGNPLVASVELGGALVTSVLAILAPFMAIALAVIVIGLLLYRIYKGKTASNRGVVLNASA